MRNPLKMWNTQETILDTARSYMGRQDLLFQFPACPPKEDKPLKAYFTKLSIYCTQLDHTDYAITDCDFGKEIFTSLPSQYAMKVMVLKHRRPLPTPEEAMHALLEVQTKPAILRNFDIHPRGPPIDPTWWLPWLRGLAWWMGWKRSKWWKQ
jgi:hypothetical protein